MKQSNEKLFTAVGMAAKRHLNEFKPQELANTAWAFVTAQQPDEKLFTSFATVVEQRVGAFNMQNLRTALWVLSWQTS